MDDWTPGVRVAIVGANDNMVYGLDAKNLRLLWKYRTGGAVKAPVAVGRVRVAKTVHGEDGEDAGATISVAIFGSWDDKVYALDTTTGDVVWTFRCKDKIMSGAAIDAESGLVFVGSHDNHMYALNASTGIMVWSYQTGNIVMSSPSVTRNHVVFGSSDGHLYALHKKSGCVCKLKTNVFHVVIIIVIG